MIDTSPNGFGGRLGKVEFLAEFRYARPIRAWTGVPASVYARSNRQMCGGIHRSVDSDIGVLSEASSLV